MKTLQKVGGIAALICAGTFILAMGLVATLLTPMLDSSLPYDQFMAFYLPHRSLVFLWHFSMYLVNGTFLTLLVLALYQQFKTSAPALSLVATCFGLFWTGLIFASGFISLYGWQTIDMLSSTDPSQAETLRLVVYNITTRHRHLRPLPGLSVGAAHQLGRPAHPAIGQAVELLGPCHRHCGHRRFDCSGAERVGIRLWGRGHRLVGLAGDCAAARRSCKGSREPDEFSQRGKS